MDNGQIKYRLDGQMCWKGCVDGLKQMYSTPVLKGWSWKSLWFIDTGMEKERWRDQDMDNLIMNGKMIGTWSVKGVDGCFDG